ncbi:alanine--glyoxylate aminotransferase family protein [Acidobacteria bacterium AH-259-A15]|nr:alanine--glyoxylate aminotransferase family protein [Acidobacteria bacterium AH-259-A15]
MRKTRIFTPGPTPLMPQAQLAMSRPIIHHRTEEFKELLLETRRYLQEIFKTENDIVILASSGTGAMEAAVCNLLCSEDHALAIVAGKFGQRWVEICRAHAIACIPLCKESGQAASAEEICDALGRQSQIRSILIQGCETSTATSHDLERIARLVGEKFPEVFIVVDAITSLLTQPMETDRWGLDIVIGGSQKAFGLPPGLAFLSLSPRVIEKIQSNLSRPYYFDLLQELRQQRKGQSTFTPAISLITGLNETTREILRQGPDRVVADANLMARCTRQGLSKLGFKLLSSSPATALTAAFPPQGVSAADLVNKLEKEFGIKVAGGQGKLKNKIVRIAHLGYFDLVDVFSVLSAIELCLFKMGVKVELGDSVRAAMLEATGTKDPIFT